MSDGPDLSDAPSLERMLALLPASTGEICDDLDVANTTVESYRNRLQDNYGVTLEYDRDENEWRYVGMDVPEDDTPDPILPDLSGVEEGGDPSQDELVGREEYLLGELQTGATVGELADDMNTRPSVVTQHLRDLKRQGWQVYVDEDAEHVAVEGDHNLRSSEHKGTRTRKANQWWQLRHNALAREFKSLQSPTTTLDADAGNEDWVTHLTDLHAGDRERSDDGTVIYETDEVPDVIDYTTERSLALADKHNSTYDAARLLWGGDFLTNSGIYEGQFEDLDAWLDEQHDTLVSPLIRQLKAFSERFPSVQVVCQVGNHGRHRASGTSRQANADLILYKHIRNTVAHIQQHADHLDNVDFKIGQAKAYRNFELRGGALRGHLRHGQHRQPQAQTSARKKEWLATLREHEFDICAMGHHHVGGVIPWDGPPVICTPSPKPSGEFVERLGESVSGGEQGIATAFGVCDDGVTAIFPIDTRHY